MVNQDLLGLAPCPFCGGEAELRNGGPGNWYVHCNGCQCNTNDVQRERAIELWNTRALSAECGVKALADEPAKKLYTHMGHTHEVSYPHLSDEDIAHKVRMLMRSDLDHEGVVVGARDRILYLIARNKELSAALRSALAPGVGEAVAYRWRVKGATNWVYDPDQDWLDHHQNDPDVDVEPLYLHPAPPSTGVREALDKLRNMNAAEYLRVVARDTRHVFDKNELPKIAALIDAILSGLGESSRSETAYLEDAGPAPADSGYLLEWCQKHPVDAAATIEKLRRSTPAAYRERIARDDSALLDWLRDETCDLRCINAPTGGDDYDVRWQVIQHHMAKPHERIIGRSYSEEPRDAISDAILSTGARR